MAGIEIYQLFKLKQNFIKEQVVELKASEFKPEYIGQLGFYVTAINETIKKNVMHLRLAYYYVEERTE